MTVQVFICHNHRDHRYLSEDSLLGYLKALEQDGTTTFWYDERIVTGDLWDEEIKKAISNSGVALILVSQWLLNSKYVMNEEIPNFLKKRKQEGMIIFPVILSACEWQRHDWLERTHCLPRDDKNIESHYCQHGAQMELFNQILADLRIQIGRIAKKSMTTPNKLQQSSQATSVRVIVPDEVGKPHIETMMVEPKEMWRNPFSLLTANDMSPEEISSLFVGDYTDFTTIKKNFDTILEGQRGTGKTMVLRYLWLGAQFKELIEKGESPAGFLQEPSNSIGIYCRLEQGVFDKSDLDAVDSDDRKEQLFEHRLCLHCLACQDGILDTIGLIVTVRPTQPRELQRLNSRLANLLAEPRLESCVDWEETINFAKDIINIRVTEEDRHLSSISPGGSPTEFNPYLTMSGQIVPFLEFARNLFNLPCPFFLMLDDFDVLRPSQQMCVFRTASARNLGTLCFKYGIMSLGKKTNSAGTGRTYREGDDYDLISLDWTDQKGLLGNYKKATEIIVSKRLKATHWPTSDFPSLLATWAHGKQIREELKKEMFAKWQQLHPSMKPKTAESYWTKYGDAMYFQKLSALRTNHRYAGFLEIVDISAGIYRQLLEICRTIVDRALASGWTPTSPSPIAAEIQDRAIREYSNAMMNTLSQAAGDTTALLSGVVPITSKHMVTLIESISDLFYARLHSRSGEPEIFCIAIKNDIDANPFAKSILDVAVRESILHRRSADYPSKTKGEPRLPTYMLNRRLAPRRSLGVRMQGRIEMLTSDIELAAIDRTAFMNKFGKIKVRRRKIEGPRLFDNSEQIEDTQ